MSKWIRYLTTQHGGEVLPPRKYLPHALGAAIEHLWHEHLAGDITIRRTAEGGARIVSGPHILTVEPLRETPFPLPGKPPANGWYMRRVAKHLPFVDPPQGPPDHIVFVYVDAHARPLHTAEPVHYAFTKSVNTIKKRLPKHFVPESVPGAAGVYAFLDRQFIGFRRLP